MGDVGEGKAVSFQTASGKPVSFTASAKRKPKKKIVETPVEEPQEAPEEPPQEAKPEPKPKPVVQEAPEEPPQETKPKPKPKPVVQEAPQEPEALESPKLQPPAPPPLERQPKPRGRPKGSANRPKPAENSSAVRAAQSAIQERLPPKQPVTYAPEPPPAPEMPSYPRMSQDELSGMLSDFFHASKAQRRDARVAMYRSWLSA